MQVTLALARRVPRICDPCCARVRRCNVKRQDVLPSRLLRAPWIVVGMNSSHIVSRQKSCAEAMHASIAVNTWWAMARACLKRTSAEQDAKAAHCMLRTLHTAATHTSTMISTSGRMCLCVLQIDWMSTLYNSLYPTITANPHPLHTPTREQ